jgi:putative endonuclease
VYQHRTKATSGFTSRYSVGLLGWFESYDDPTFAITREKAIKKWRRDWKIALNEETNPHGIDLYNSITK